MLQQINSNMHPCHLQSPRREDDIAIVNAGMRVRLEPAPDASGTWHVAEAAVAYGGVAARAVMAPAVAAAMVGKAWGPDTLQVGGAGCVDMGRQDFTLRWAGGRGGA